MTKDIKQVDITNVPELLWLAEDVRRTGQPPHAAMGR